METRVALFGKKNSESADQPDEADSPRPSADSTKAAQFFEHARTMHEAANEEYAATLWLQGIARDPASMTGLEGFYESSQAFVASRGKFGPSKDQLKAVRNIKAAASVTRLIPALLQWGTCPLDAGAGLKVVEAMNKIDGIEMAECVYWVGEKVLTAARRSKKTKKDTFVRLKNVFVGAGVFDLGVMAGEIALELDPEDRVLQSEIRNLSAQVTMSSGGYEQTGQAGGFRANIRDAEGQRRLEDQDRLVKTEDVIERAIHDAQQDYESRPEDTAAIMRYARALLDRATSADEKTAFDLLTAAYAQTKEFRFRQQAGDIRIRQARRKIAQLRRRVEAAPEDAAAKDAYRKGRRALLKLEADEYALRIKAYPTDLGLKFELGKRLYELGRYEESIELFQAARQDAKRRARCLSYLGQAFLSLGWQDEAIETLRAAIEAHPNPNDEISRGLRYGLMAALEKKAADGRDLAAAEEAAQIASGIAVEQITFRDIRDRRTALQTLIKDLRAASSS